MKVALISQIFPVREQPYRGHSVYQTALRMARMVDLRAYSPHPRYTSILRPKTRGWLKIDESYSPGGVETRYLNYPAIAGLSRPFNGWICARYLEPLLREDPPDVILSYWVYPDGFAAVQLGKTFGVPVLVKAIGSDVNASVDPLSTYLVRRVLREANVVLTVSEALRGKIVGMGINADRVRAITNGCETSTFFYGDRAQARRQCGIGDETELIVFIGRFDPAKGLAELVHAMAELVTQRPKAKLVLIGEGSGRSVVESLGTQLRVSEHIHFAGVMPSKQVADWLRAANIFTLPSYREGCPNVVLEALSCGVPVVATDVGGIPELVDSECGILVPAQDSTALARALRQALERSWNREAIAARTRRSWEDVAAETVAVCESTITAVRRSPQVAVHSLTSK